MNKISSNPVNDLWNARPVLALTLLVAYVARNSRSLLAQAQATISQDVHVIFNHSERQWVSFVSNHIKDNVFQDWAMSSMNIQNIVLRNWKFRRRNP